MNVQRHGIRFEQAREAFFDQLAQYVVHVV